MYLFNKKKFKKLPERCEWDHEINFMEEAPRELNAKVYNRERNPEPVVR